jgi:hypothetical protein
MNVFRAAVVSIVLALAVGPHASLLCAVGCHPQPVSAAPCEHPDPSRSVRLVPIGNCPDFSTGAIAFLREHAGRAASTHAQPAVATSSFPPAASIGRLPVNLFAAQSPSLEARPLAIALRI